MHFQHPLAPSSDVLRQRVLWNKASSRGRLIGQNRFCATSCNCTKQFCAKSSYCTKRVLCNKASLFSELKLYKIIQNPPKTHTMGCWSEVKPFNLMCEQYFCGLHWMIRRIIDHCSIGFWEFCTFSASEECNALVVMHILPTTVASDFF